MIHIRSGPFTFFDLELPANSYMIACTNIQNFEEGENCASTISVEQTLGYDMILFGYDLILLGSRVQELSLLLVVVLINFGVKKQVPKISFKISARDLMSVSLMSLLILYFVNIWIFWK